MCGCSNFTGQYSRLTQSDAEALCRRKMESGEILREQFHQCVVSNSGTGQPPQRIQWNNVWDWLKNNVSIGIGQGSGYGGGGTPPPPPPPQKFPWGVVVGIVAAIGIGWAIVYAVKSKGK